jgi:hypothetical protein
MSPTAAQELAEAVVTDGFGPHRAALAALFAGSRRLGVDPVLVAVAADPTEALVARQRALGRVVVDYARLRGAGASPGRLRTPAA